MQPSPCRSIIGVRVDGTSYAEAASHILKWAQAGDSRYVCICNVHMVMEACDDDAFRRVVNNADLVTPDGMPLVWALRVLGVRDATRVDGSTITLRVCEAAAQAGIPIALYGGSEETLAAFTAFAKRRFPGIEVAAAIAPPFRVLSEDEQAADLKKIASSGARIIFVALGCPKQEKWMAEARRHVPAVMLGIGAALDFHAGRVARAPGWMQRAGLEWFFRLLCEPRRLWRRYAKHNPRFLWLFILQVLHIRRYDIPASGC